MLAFFHPFLSLSLSLQWNTSKTANGQLQREMFTSRAGETESATDDLDLSTASAAAAFEEAIADLPMAIDTMESAAQEHQPPGQREVGAVLGGDVVEDHDLQPVAMDVDAGSPSASDLGTTPVSNANNSSARSAAAASFDRDVGTIFRKFDKLLDVSLLAPEDSEDAIRGAEDAAEVAMLQEDDNDDCDDIFLDCIDDTLHSRISADAAATDVALTSIEGVPQVASSISMDHDFSSSCGESEHENPQRKRKRNEAGDGDSDG